MDHSPFTGAPERASAPNHTAVRTVAAALANARAGRRGSPAIANVLDVLQGTPTLSKLHDEVMEDAHAALTALAELPKLPSQDDLNRAFFVDVCRAEARLKEFIQAGRALLDSLPENWHDDATIGLQDLVDDTEAVLVPGSRHPNRTEDAWRDYVGAAAQTSSLAMGARIAILQPSAGALDVLAERRRHVASEGWTAEHDDLHDKGELSRGAIQYAAAAALTMALGGKSFDADTAPPLDSLGFALGWPWKRSWWKPGLVRRMLVKAAALLHAEIDRLDRAEGRTDG